MFSLIYVWKKGQVNNRDAGELWRRRAHYGITVMEHYTGAFWDRAEDIVD